MRWRIAIAAAAILVAEPALAVRADDAKSSVVQIVPTAGWQGGKLERLAVEAVSRWGGEPAIEREYGVQFLEHQVYRQGLEVAEVIAEPAADATSAYGLLTYYRTGDMAPVAGMPYAVSGPPGALMLRSRQFIRIVPPQGETSELSAQDLRDLLRALGAASPMTEDMKTLPAPMPARDLMPGSEKYLLGPQAAQRILPSVPAELLGFSLGAEVETGEYRFGTSRPTVAVVTTPTPQIARELFGQMKKQLGLNQANLPKPAFGKQEGSFVVLVLHADSAEAAGQLMNLFKLNAQVSWDRPYPGKKPPLYQMLEFVVQNLIFTFYLCGWSVVGGILFFLSRRAARRLFPNSFLGQPDEGNIITLNLS